MHTAVVIVFVMGYLAIAFEHSLRINKTVPALITACLCWSFIALGAIPVFEVNTTLKTLEPSFIDPLLLHHLGKTAEILIFLVGAMTIVEIVDMHLGFDILKISVQTQSKVKLLWILSILAFFLSAIIDNLTATIILITLLRKLIGNQKERLYYTGILVWERFFCFPNDVYSSKESHIGSFLYIHIKIFPPIQEAGKNIKKVLSSNQKGIL